MVSSTWFYFLLIINLSVGLIVTVDIPLWKGAALKNISLTFEDKAGYSDSVVKMNANANVLLPTSNVTNLFDVNGSVTSTSMTLASSLENAAGVGQWDLAIGKGFSIHDMELGLTSKKAGNKTSWTGNLHGLMAFGSTTADVSAVLPAADGETYEFSAVLKGSVTASEAAKAATDTSSLTGGSSSGGSASSEMSAVTLKDAKLKFKIRPGSEMELQIDSTVDLFGGTGLEAVLSVNETSDSASNGTKWGVAFGVAMESDFEMSDIASGLAPLDNSITYGDAWVVASDCATSVSFKDMDSTVVMKEAGLHFHAEVPVNGTSKLAPLSEWVGNGDVAAFGTWGATEW